MMTTPSATLETILFIPPFGSIVKEEVTMKVL